MSKTVIAVHSGQSKVTELDSDPNICDPGSIEVSHGNDSSNSYTTNLANKISDQLLVSAYIAHISWVI